MKPAFLKAEWRKLALSNYSIDPKILLPYVPFGTELDLWKGKCYVSLVGFMFLNTRLKGIPIPFHRNFEEVNLRFYVRYKEGNEWRRGVTFIKEIVPRPFLTLVANSVYHEKYVTLPMKHRWEESNAELSVSYSWFHRQKWNTFSVKCPATPVEMPVGSDEEFITEHYWGYTSFNSRKSSEYAVEHPRWKTYAVKEFDIDVDFGGLYGSPFSHLTTQQPDSVMLAEGSEIVVRSKRVIQ